MSSLADLNLNRYLYKGDDNVPPDSSLMFGSNNNTTNYGANGGDETIVPPASSIAPGTLISSTVIQTSPSDDRIELNSSNGLPGDTLYVYNDGVVVLTIDKDGISSIAPANFDVVNITTANITTANITTENVTTSNITTANVDTLNVAVEFNYNGIAQPVMYTGFVNGVTGAISNGPVGWTGAKSFSPGGYTITHNLGLAAPYFRVFVTSNTTVGEAIVYQVNGNAIEIEWYDTAGATDDTDFTFLALQYLP